jgi:hypothetical protein
MGTINKEWTRVSPALFIRLNTVPMYVLGAVIHPINFNTYYLPVKANSSNHRPIPFTAIREGRKSWIL